MRREITMAQLLAWLAALVGGAGALAFALLVYLAGSDATAAAFAGGGLLLALWAGVHITDRQ